MRKWLLLPLFIFIFTCSLHGQVFVDPNLPTIELIGDILIDKKCAQTFNYSSSTGDAYGVDGIGYFNATNSDFPFSEGIILSTGQAIDAVGPNVGQNSSGEENWKGDYDLSQITNTQDLFNASYIQFNFVPITNQISFNFILASEEYFGDYQCYFSDVFAFILTDESGNSSNLAIVPGTDDPVSIVNIRTGVSGVCSPKNASFFGRINNENSDISFHGITKSLTAISDVIPGANYTIKLVIADNIDSLVDSAIFLEASSFTADLELGESRSILNENPLCVGEEVELDISSIGDVLYKWYRGSTELTEFEDTPNITISESGNYTAEVTVSGSCIISAEITLDFVEPPVIAEPPLTLTKCEQDNNGSAIFRLNENSDIVLGTQDRDIYQVTYYNSMENAIAFENQFNADIYRSQSSNETIFVRISSGNSCFEIASFQINVESLNLDLSTFQESYFLCRDENLNAVSPLPKIITGLPENQYSFSWFRDTPDEQNRIVGETNSTLTPNQVGTYFVEVKNIEFGCAFIYDTEIIPRDPPTIFEIDFLSGLFSENETIAIIAEGNTDYLFSLDGSTFTEENIFENLSPGEHIAQVTDIYGCTVQSLTFQVIAYPRFFTPNGDGINDKWSIVLGDDFENIKISIFNRYGKLIHSLTDIQSWDGTFSSTRLPSSDYWFLLSYEKDAEEKLFNGHFSLKR